MNWLALTLLSVVIVSVANILQKVLMKNHNSNPSSYAIIFHFFLAIISAIFALLLEGFQLPLLDKSILSLLAAAFLWGTGTVFLFKALQVLEASEVTILISVRSIITIIASIIFLKESFNIQQGLGATLILISVFLVSNLKKGIKFNKGLLYSGGVVLSYGTAIIFDVINLKIYNPISYIALTNILVTFVLLIIYPKTVLLWKEFVQTDFLKKIIPLSFFSSTQAIAYYFALKVGNVSQIAPIGQSQVILTVLIAAVFLHERDNLFRKIIAAVMVMIGIILLR